MKAWNNFSCKDNGEKYVCSLVPKALIGSLSLSISSVSMEFEKDNSGNATYTVNLLNKTLVDKSFGY